MCNVCVNVVATLLIFEHTWWLVQSVSLSSQTINQEHLAPKCDPTFSFLGGHLNLFHGLVNVCRETFCMLSVKKLCK